MSATASERRPTVTLRESAILAALTTKTLKPSPSGTSAATGTVTARGLVPMVICPKIVSPMRSGRAPAGARPLRIGETIFGQITMGTKPRAVTVPVAALVPDGDGFKVFVVNAANIALSRKVTVGRRSDAVADITSGLSGGERVVTEGAYGVEDSVKVTSTK